MAQRGNIDYLQIQATDRQGNGSKLQMFGGGTAKAGNALVFDSAGSAVDSGVVPGGGSGGYTLPPASASVLGGVKIGANVSVQVDGTISVAAPTAPYVLPVATTTVLGGVKQGSNVTIAGDGTLSVAAPGAGTVTSVGLSMPAEFSVASSPVTGSGTLAVTKATQLANLVYAGPASGGAAVPTFRALTAADLSAVAVGLQTPWLSNINAAGFSLSNVGAITASSTITATGLITGSVATPANGYLRVVASPLYGDTNDGRITVALGAPGLNIVGINTDNTARKIAFWGALTQMDTGAITFGGTLNTKGISNTAGNIDNWGGPIRALSAQAFYAYNAGNTQYGTFGLDGNSNLNIGVSGGLSIIFNGLQVWGGAVNANTQNLSNVNSLTAAGITVSGVVATNTVQANGGDGYVHFPNWIKVDTIAPQAAASVSINTLSTTTTGAASINCGGWGVKFPNIGATPHVHAFYWSGSLAAYIDGSSVGTITITSERWMKEDIQPYDRGLDAIRQLSPVSFKYIPQPWRGLGQTHYGLVADEVEPLIPEMVTRETTNVEGEEKELRYLDPRPMWYMLVNAVKELDKRLKALEQAIKVN